MSSNRIGISNSETDDSTTVLSRTICEYFRRRKLLWIVIIIVVLILIIIIPIIIIKKKRTSIEYTTTAEMTKTEIQLTTEQILPSFIIDINTTWKQEGLTIAGGNQAGDELNQLNGPHSIYVDDDDQNVYIADRQNHRIVKWKFDGENGEVVAGGNGHGNELNRLNEPTDAIPDKKKDFLVICDYRNQRVMQWSLRNKQDPKKMMITIDCWGLSMDKNGDLYISERHSYVVKRYKYGDTNGIIVAGGTEEGNGLNNLYGPSYIFVDQYFTVYVADFHNGRVMKWIRNATHGVLVARGQVPIEHPNLPILVSSVIIDHQDNIYISDSSSHKIMRWSPGAIEGHTIAGQDEAGNGNTHLHYPCDLSFDRQGNIYVVDSKNHRIQKFPVVIID